MWAPVLFLSFLFIYFFMDDFQFVVFFKVFNPDVLNNGTLAPKTLNTTEIIKIKKKLKKSSSSQAITPDWLVKARCWQRPHPARQKFCQYFGDCMTDPKDVY